MSEPAASRAEPRRVLGLDDHPDPADLKAAFRYLAKKYHPDRSGDPRTGARFVRVAKAYKILHLRLSKTGLLNSELGGSADASGGGGSADLFAIGAELLNAASPARRRQAARRLGFTGKKAAYVFLRRALDDPDESVVAAAVRSIADLSLYQASGELTALWARSGAGIRRAILDAAEDTGEAVFASVLELAAKSADPLGVRARSLRR